MRVSVYKACSLGLLLAAMAACSGGPTPPVAATATVTAAVVSVTAAQPAPQDAATPGAVKAEASQGLATTPAAELRATLEAGLPPTVTPDASGFAENGFDGIQVLPLADAGGEEQYWAAVSQGAFSYEPWQPHYVEIYTHQDGSWQVVDRLELENAQFVAADGVRQVMVEPGSIWLEIHSGVGAHGGCYDLLRFDGVSLDNVVAHCHDSPQAGELVDLNGDESLEVVLDQTNNYVFCYACGVRQVGYRVLRWDGSHLVEVRLSALTEPAATGAETLNNRAVELAGGGLWLDAQDTIGQLSELDALPPADRWNAILIKLQAEAMAEQARLSDYPLLDNVFYGDYATALDLMRFHPVEEIFNVESPLIQGTVAEGWVPELSEAILEATGQVLSVEPRLAAALFLRAWATYLADPEDRQVRQYLERAARLAPGEKLFRDSVRLVAGRLVETPTPAPETPSLTIPLSEWPLQLGSSWVYEANMYDTFDTEDISATYVITETVVDMQISPPYTMAQVVQETTLVGLSENLAGKEWETSYLAGPGSTTPFWYVISGTQVYAQQELKLESIAADQATLVYGFPLYNSARWFPYPEQRREVSGFAARPGTRVVDGPVERQVPAGTYTDCFEIRTLLGGGSPSEWFCAGVGVVERQFHNDGTPFGNVTVLMRYNNGSE